MNIYVGLWAAFAVTVLVLAMYRNLLGIRAPGVHVSPTAAGLASTQKQEFAKEERVERWGQWLTVGVVLYGLILAAAYLYRTLEHGRIH